MCCGVGVRSFCLGCQGHKGWGLGVYRSRVWGLHPPARRASGEGLPRCTWQCKYVGYEQSPNYEITMSGIKRHEGVMVLMCSSGVQHFCGGRWSSKPYDQITQTGKELED